MRVNSTVLLQFSLLSFASVVARYLDNTHTFQGSATTHCLDSHPNWQTRGMSDKESASYGDGPHMEAPRLGTPQTLAACGANGAPMYTEDEVPERFVIGCCGDMKEATRRWKETYKWRKANKVDEIIDTPQPHFHQCRQVFPVYLHGRSHKGMPVLWDVIGKVNLARANELNMDLALLTPYYVFFNECIWRVVLDKGENDDDRAQFITVEDVGGVRPWHLTPRVLNVLRSLTGTMKAHYIERCYKTYIINAPSAFTVLWRVVAPMLDPRTREKVSILGTNYLAAMEKDIDISQIPPEYGGRSGRAIDDSDDERKILSLVARLNARGGGGKEGSTGDVEGLPKEGNDVPGKLELST